MRTQPTVEKLFIDMEFVINATNFYTAITLPAGLCQKIEHYKTLYPELVISIFYDDNNVINTPSPTAEHATTLQFSNTTILETSFIKRILIEQYPDLLSEATLTFNYIERLENHVNNRTFIITSNPTLKCIFENEQFNAEVELTDYQSLQERQSDALIKIPHQLHPTDAENAKNVFHNAPADQIIYIALDYDDTILRNAKSMMEKDYFVNQYLIEHLADLFNKTESLANVQLMVVSARVENHEVMPIEKGLARFLESLNAKISSKHPSGITANDIFCMRHEVNTGKSIITAIANNNDILDIWLTNTPHTPTYWTNQLSEEKKSIPHSVRIKHIKPYDHENKSIFFAYYFLSLKKFLSKENFIVLMYDDNPMQVAAMRKLNEEETLKGLLHCIKVFHPDECNTFIPTPPKSPVRLGSQHRLFPQAKRVREYQNYFSTQEDEVNGPLGTPEPLDRDLSSAPLNL